MMTTSRPRASAAATASKATAAGSAPDSDETKSAPARSAHVSSCSPAAARKVSPAPITQVLPASRRCQAILPIEVVLPVPLTPVIRITDGVWVTSIRASPSGVISSATISVSRPVRSADVDSRPAADSASSRSITVTVAGTPQSAAISASSSCSHTSGSAGFSTTPASCWLIARRLRPIDSRSRENMPPDRSSGSGSGGASSPVLNIACHVRVTGADRSVCV